MSDVIQIEVTEENTPVTIAVTEQTQQVVLSPTQFVGVPGQIGPVGPAGPQGPKGDSGSGVYEFEDLTPSPDGSRVDFTFSSASVSGRDCVFVNGLAQDRGAHYTISGTIITFDDPPESGDVLKILYQQA